MNTTFTKQANIRGSKAINWNVDRDGEPFGAIWTYKKTRTETFMFHAKAQCGSFRYRHARGFITASAQLAEFLGQGDKLRLLGMQIAQLRFDIVARAKRRGQFAVAASDMHHQTALDAGGLQNGPGRVRSIGRM